MFTKITQFIQIEKNIEQMFKGSKNILLVKYREEQVKQ